MDKERLQQYIEDGKSSYRIAKAEGVSPSTIKYWLKKHNLKTKLNSNYNNYTDEDIIKFAAETKSIAQLLTKLGKKPRGGNYHCIKNKLQKLNINTSHWTGQAWNKDAQLKDWSDYYTNGSCRKILLKERGYCCEQCKLSEWFGFILPIEMHHIDGNRLNNDKINLILLCPNCHSITDNFKGKNKVPQEGFEPSTHRF